jgi:hypothetical protein
MVAGTAENGKSARRWKGGRKTAESVGRWKRSLADNRGLWKIAGVVGR